MSDNTKTCDFDEVKRLLKEGVKATLNQLRADHPDEHFYAFALYDADGDAVAPSANTEERYQKMIQRSGVADSDERFTSRWGTAEWAFEAEEYGGQIEKACEMLQNADAPDFLAFQVQSFGTSIMALKELADEGFFHSGDKPITVFFSLSDHDEAAWLERESARRINPPEVFAAFEPEWKIAAKLMWGEDADEMEPGEIGQAFLEKFGQG